MYKLTRDVTQKECTWLDRTFKKGEVVYKYYGCTYGACRDEAYTLEDNILPFFELPDDSVKEVK
jgi:hypothetical protein